MDMAGTGQRHGMIGKQTGIAGGAAETVWPGPQISLFQEEVLSKQEVIALIERSVFVVKVDCTQVSAPGMLDSERHCFADRFCRPRSF